MWTTNSNNQMILSSVQCAKTTTVTARNDCQASKEPNRAHDGACGLVSLSLQAADLLYSWQLCMGTSDKTYVK